MGCHSKGMSKQWDATAKGCQRKGMAKEWNVPAKECQSKGMSKRRDVKATGCQSSGMSELQLSLFGGTSRAKTSFSQCQLSDFEGKSRTKASFSHLPSSLFEGGLARNVSLNVSGCTKYCNVLQGKTRLGRWMGKVCRGTVPRRFRLYRKHWSAPAVYSFKCRPRFAQLELQNLKDISHQSFVFTSSTFRF